jgi:hypothetical protein
MNDFSWFTCFLSIRKNRSIENQEFSIYKLQLRMTNRGSRLMVGNVQTPRQKIL